MSPDAWYQRVVAFQSHQGLVSALLAGVSGAALIAGGEGTSQNPPREFPRSRRGTTGTGNGTGNQAADDLRRYDDAVERADSGKATARAPCNEDRPRTGALRWMAADALGLSHWLNCRECRLVVLSNTALDKHIRHGTRTCARAPRQPFRCRKHHSLMV